MRRATLAVKHSMLCDVADPHARVPLQKAHSTSATRSLGVKRWTRTRLSCKSGSTVSEGQSGGTTPALPSEVRSVLLCAQGFLLQFNTQTEVSLSCRRYARKQFQAEVHAGRPDAQVNLAKACMLIALEEEAAYEEELLQSNSSDLAWLNLLSKDIQQQDELEDVELSVVNG